MNEIKDLCIIGSGPAGLSAAVYAARYRVNQVLVGEQEGGAMMTAHKVCNYPSEIEITGRDLTKKMVEHVKQLAIPYQLGSVIGVSKKDGYFEVKLSSDEVISAKKLLLATGTTHRHLGLPKEADFLGHGVSYCATCDGMFYRNKIVAIVGGSESANTAALYLAGLAKKVYQIFRGPALLGEVAWIEQIKQNEKIELILNSQVVALNGESYLESLDLDKEFNGDKKLIVDGLFVEDGSVPDLTLINQLQLKTDEHGQIITAVNQGTSQDGVWAAGDITTGSDGFRQIITACSEGAVAAKSIFSSLQKDKADVVK